MYDFDGVLKELGQFSRYQVTAYALLFFPLAMYAACSMTYVFTTADIDYRCFVPECENNESQKYDQPWLKNALPFKDGALSDHCSRYKPQVNYSNGTCSREKFSKETQECERYVFANDFYAITRDFNLLCEKNDWKRTLVGTTENVGMVLAAPLAGILSDRFGRKPLIVWSLILTGIFGTLRSFSTTYLEYIIGEALDAISHSGLFNAVYIYGSEVVGPDMRGLGGAIVYIYFTFGEVILGAIVWLVNDWHIYLKIIYIPTFIVGVAYIWILPESIRWLITNGKNEEAQITIEKLARWNNKTLTNEVQDTINSFWSDVPNAESIEKGPSREEKIKSPLSEVLKSKTILLRLMNCSYCWFVNSAIFYGLSIYAVNIGGNKYLNFILVSIVEIPACIIFYFLVNRGRKLALILGLVVSAAACLTFHFIPQDSTMSLITYFIGKLAISGSSTAICILASETFPTDFRNTLFGFASTVAVIGTIVAPQVPLIAKYVDPLLIFGGMAISASVLGLFFPETRNCAMPDSLKEAEDMGKK